MLTFGSEKRTQKANKKAWGFFCSTQNNDLWLDGKKGCISPSPVGPSISRIATSERGAGVGGIHKISFLIPRVKSEKESGAVLGRGFLYMAACAQGKACLLHPRGWLCQLSSPGVCGLCLHYVVPSTLCSMAPPLLRPVPQMEAR